MAVITMAIPFLIVAVLFAVANFANMGRTEYKILLSAVAVGAVVFVIHYTDAIGYIRYRRAMSSAPAAETAFLRTLADRPAPPAGACLRPPAANGWIGAIAHTYLTSVGRGTALAVRIARHVRLSTDMTTDSHDTLIPADAPAFAALADLQEGDYIRLSGDFVRDDEGCAVLTFGGDSHDHEFLFRFSAIAPARAK